MRDTSDFWYIRLPDGRVLRAAGTSVVRQQLASGRIPLGTRIRRSREEQWRAPERYPEFADLDEHPGDGASLVRITPEQVDAATVQPASIASRLDAAGLRTSGVRGMLEELLAAFDSTMARRKLVPAALAGALLGALAGLTTLPFFSFSLQPPGAGWLLLLAGIVLVAWLAGLLSRLTFVELSRLRPASWSEGQAGIGPLVVRLSVAYLLGGLIVGGLLFALRWLPDWLLSRSADGVSLSSVAAQAIAALAIPLEAMLWLSLVLLLPVAALLVIEEGSPATGFSLWRRLVRENAGPLLLGETLAGSIGLLFIAPAVLLVTLLGIVPVDPRFAVATSIARASLAGVVLGGFLAYLAVANVFLVLQLRYGVARKR